MSIEDVRKLAFAEARSVIEDELQKWAVWRAGIDANLSEDNRLLEWGHDLIAKSIRDVLVPALEKAAGTYYDVSKLTATSEWAKGLGK